MKHWNSRLTEFAAPVSGRRTWLLWLGVSLIGALLLAACSRAAGGGPAPAGIAIAPQFAEFVAANGGERVFGRPLTTIYSEQATGLEVQYFTRMRLEQPAAGPVALAPLGAWALTGLAPIDEGPAPPPAVDATFAEFYDAHGGAAFFGRPLSPQIQEGDLWVQYFQSARLEWHPELSRANRVQVGQLGTAHFYGTSAVAEYEAQRKLDTVNMRVIQESSLAVDASLAAPILFQGDVQVVYAIVTTADGVSTVEDAAVVAVLGDETIALGRTGPGGTLAAPLPLPALDPGDRVDLEVQVLDDNGAVLARALLTFSAWW